MTLRRRIDKLEAGAAPVWGTLVVVAASTDEPPYPDPRFYLVSPDGEKVQVTAERYNEEVARSQGPVQVILPPEFTSQH